MKTLVPGQRTPLHTLTSHLEVGVSIEIHGNEEPALLLCFLANDKEQVPDAKHLLGVREESSPCSSVSVVSRDATKQRFRVDLTKVPDNVQKIIFALAFQDTAGQALPAHASRMIGQGNLRLMDGETALAEFPFTGEMFGKEKAILLGEFYRKDGWRFLASGSGFYGGLGALMAHFRAPIEALRPPGSLPAGNLPPLPSQSGQHSGYGPKPGSGPRPEGFHPIRLPGDWPGRKAPSLPGGLVHAVGLVIGHSPADGYYTGTGFVISPGGYMLTCEHNVRGASELGFRAEGTTITRPLIVLATDPANDIALVWLADGLGSTDWLLLAKPDQAPALGDELGLLSYPLGVTLGDSVTYSQGIVNGIRTWDGCSVLQADTGGAPGSSGAPLFRRSDGRVVGIHKSGLRSSEAIMVKFATDMREFFKLGWAAPEG